MEYGNRIQHYAAMETYVGQLDNADGTGESGLSNDDAGHRIGVRFTLKLDGECVSAVRFQVFGCGYTIAACSAVAELCAGKTLTDTQAVDAAAVRKLLGNELPEERYYCADLASQAYQAALQSSLQGGSVVEVVLREDTERGPRVTADDPLYRALLASCAQAETDLEDRRLFASLVTVAAQEGYPMNSALGLSSEQLERLFALYFPDFNRAQWVIPKAYNAVPPAINPDIVDTIFSFLPPSTTEENPAFLLALILAARAAHPGHLWVAMGLLERAQLSAAIKRHLPALAAANNKGMRWKRFLFKHVCDRNGSIMCKTPNCGDCSDYALCFVSESDA
jgi:nitrogen fixation protein NifQ